MTVPREETMTTMIEPFELTSTYVVASGSDATCHEGGETFWRRLSQHDPKLASADGGWLISSYTLDSSWPNWEMHPNGDEIVCSRSGACDLVIETDEGNQEVSLTPGRTVVIPKGTWHTVQVPEHAELLHITYGSGTTFKPVSRVG
jgi:mannose-6-phosphate isomerase-like protein (cupin superfamily)